MRLIDVLIEVLTSWQVIAATLTIFFFFHIVSYVSRRYRRPRALKLKKPNLFKKKSSDTPAVKENIEELPVSDANDELGLEEA